MAKIDVNNNLCNTLACKKSFVNNIADKSYTKYCLTWSEKIVNDTGKLRTYKLFKQHYGAEPYCIKSLPRRHRSALGKFRCGVAPLRIETGRYTGIPVNLRHCVLCNDGNIEDEKHVLIECETYTNIRNVLITEAKNVINNFCNMSAFEKFTAIFSNEILTEILAKTCFQILKERNKHIYINTNT